MLKQLKDFLQTESAGGIVLMVVAALAMLAANSPFASQYEALVGEPTVFWINDGLMAVFFLLVGIEIKRELTSGELSTRAQAMLPCIAAMGGVLLPALIFSAFNWGQDEMRGWAIPSATDIAFSLGILSLFGKRLPSSLKVFLMAIAVIDDLAAVVIIGIFYTAQLFIPALAWAGVISCVLCYCNRRKVAALTPYLVLGAALWLAILKSGIHPTVAGVLLGIIMPAAPAGRLMQKLHPLVAFGVVPLFAFANAGIPVLGLKMSHVLSPVTAGIAFGLFLGKQLGIFMASWLLIRCRFARLPSGVNWLELYAACMIAGIGFTMSLFIGSLAFPGAMLQLHTRLGVILGSLASALLGSMLMALALRRKSGGT